MSTYPKSSQQSEIKPDSNSNTRHIQSSSPPEQEHNNPGGEASQNSGKESAISFPKGISRWKKLLYNPKFKKLKGQSDPSTATPSPASRPSTKALDLINFIETDLRHITDEAKELKKYEKRLSIELGKLRSRFNELQRLAEDKKDDKTNQLNEFRKNLMKLKLTIPSKYKIGSEKNGYDKYFDFIDDGAKYGDKSEKMPQLHRGHDHDHDQTTSMESKDFKTSTEFKDFESRYTELEPRSKLCLLCFAIFPQDAIIKKRLMLQWWVIEGYAPDKNTAEKIFKELTAKGFIKRENNNRSPTTGSCRVHPFHHSALVALAEREKMFNFKTGGDPTQDFSDCFQACLMGEGLISYQDFSKRYKTDVEASTVIRELIQELEKLHLLMNVDEHIIEFIDEWFSKMTNLNILYLGRWKASAIHHIEVEDPKFLKKLGALRFVKFLSLQGVSNIISLPDSVLKLTYLDVLDLRACSGLESIPEGIESLESLTHLDVSECYLLAHMPKSLSRLKKLRVLKGFFVGDADPKNASRNGCKLRDLKELKDLEKLCIYTDSMSFPNESHLKDLWELKNVTKLTITWGVGRDKPPASGTAPASGGGLPPNLKKLDLKCFPKPATREDKKAALEEKPATPEDKKAALEEKPATPEDKKAATPNWLKVKNLQGLEKMYIRGGKFSDLGQFQGIDDSEPKMSWKVKELRLKYLSEIEMEWTQLHELFPNLEYLENVSCPKLTLFPCDAKGVWTKPHAQQN